MRAGRVAVPFLPAQAGLPRAALPHTDRRALHTTLPQIAKLDANENLHPVPDELMAAVTEALQSFSSGCSAQIYPDPTQTHFRADIAKLHGISPDMVVAGSGSDDILDIIMRLVDTPNCIISTPTFGMYKFLGAITKIDIIDVPRKEGFEVDIQGIVKAVRDNKCKLVMLPSPNNPTGTLLHNDDIKVTTLLPLSQCIHLHSQRCQLTSPNLASPPFRPVISQPVVSKMQILCAEDCLVCIDEAYADFAGCSADVLLSQFPNLIVCRTFSKWAGLAGLRAGYALGHPSLIERMLGWLSAKSREMRPSVSLSLHESVAACGSVCLCARVCTTIQTRTHSHENSHQATVQRQRGCGSNGAGGAPAP